jgi:hypothetical protein
MPKLHTVYDIRNTPIQTWPVYLFFLLTALILFVFFYVRKNNESAYRPLLVIMYASLGGTILSFFIFLFCLASTLRNQALITKVFNEKRYSVVEGRVQEYHPMPAGGHDEEQFRVGDLYFTMSDYDNGILGYNHSASLGGVIRANLYVRILYPTYGHIAIFRLETE